jgi:hypothetical protein
MGLSGERPQRIDDNRVTSLAALGGMIPYIRETTALSALNNAWQPGCALYARFSTAP